jgi:hypothetical protein
VKTLLLLTVTVFGCAASHEGADCADAEIRLQELSCVEGYGQPDGLGPDGSSSEFAPVCAVIDADCVVAANDCTEARACRR